MNAKIKTKSLLCAMADGAFYSSSVLTELAGEKSYMLVQSLLKTGFIESRPAAYRVTAKGIAHAKRQRKATAEENADARAKAQAERRREENQRAVIKAARTVPNSVFSLGAM
jgi:F0F1-type ATP synthase epsilon subunit